MGKIYEQIIDRFDGGHSDDLRVKSANKYGLTKHFDAFTYPHKLVPHFKTVAEEDKTFDIVKFLYAPSAANTFRLWGLGVDVGFAYACLYMYDIDDGFGNWAGGSWFKDSAGARNEGVLFYYKNYIYVFVAGTNLKRVDITGSTNQIANYQTISYTNLAEPVHHLADDCAYFFTDNLVLRLNDTTWDGTVLTLPSNLRIVSATPYGNYLAIGCVTKGTADVQSMVYLWDRDSSLATLTERIDFGRGGLAYLVNLNNKLIGLINLASLAKPGGLIKGKVLIKQAIGQHAVTLNEILLDDSLGIVDLPEKKGFQENDKFYFVGTFRLNGDSRPGIWCVDDMGRVALEFMEWESLANAGTVTEQANIQGIYKTGGIWWIAHSDDGSVNRTDDQGGYDTTNPAVYESLIFNVGDSSKTKKLIGVEVMTEPLPTAGQVVLKYRKDADLIVLSTSETPSWTTVFTEATDDSISHGAINIESDGSNLPEFKEIQFRIESLGGAVITGLKFKYEIIDKSLF